jgi:hypothetical protein
MSTAEKIVVNKFPSSSGKLNCKISLQTRATPGRENKLRVIQRIILDPVGRVRCWEAGVMDVDSGDVLRFVLVGHRAVHAARVNTDCRKRWRS